MKSGIFKIMLLFRFILIPESSFNPGLDHPMGNIVKASRLCGGIKTIFWICMAIFFVFIVDKLK